MRTQIRASLWCLVAGLATAGCGPNAGETAKNEGPPAAEASIHSTSIDTAPIDAVALRPRVEAFCGGCHPAPPAESFPKSAWPLEVERGFDFYFESFRTDLDPPPKEEVVAYYQTLAPNELSVAPPEPAAEDGSGLQFRQFSTTASDFEPPAVSFIAWQRLQREGEPQLIFCDMRSGELRALSSPGPDAECELLSSCANPAHVEPCDLDGDGQLELVVAELGSARSGDHARGAVIWLRPDGGGWKQRLLLSGVGRVSDVRPGDFDSDGDNDLLVAEFGHFRTGGISWLENTGANGGIPGFRRHIVDERHGTIHVPTADLNNDGRLDFVALVSQEYETVEAFLNQGDGTFERRTIFSAHDPAFGASGIQLVDMDADGDLDVLYSNGDTFGSEHLKPYHGIRWFENRGQYPFEDHIIGNMVGVQKALAHDLDGDNDLDVVAAALMPKNLLADPQLTNHDSVVWFEQTGPGSFVRRALERGRFFHAGLELDDFDGDGDADLAVGNMLPDEEAVQPWLTIWSNQRLDESRADDENRNAPSQPAE